MRAAMGEDEYNYNHPEQRMLIYTMFPLISGTYVFSGNCYSKVCEKTEAMRAAMGEDEYNYIHPRTEVA